MKFNEDSRVKIPVILHLMRLGYEYLSLKTAKWDLETNIFTDIFREKLFEINEGLTEDEFKKVTTKSSKFIFLKTYNANVEKTKRVLASFFLHPIKIYRI